MIALLLFVVVCVLYSVLLLSHNLIMEVALYKKWIKDEQKARDDKHQKYLALLGEYTRLQQDMQWRKDRLKENWPEPPKPGVYRIAEGS